MGSLPVIVFIAPVIGIIAVIVIPRFGKGMANRVDERYSEFRVGELAPRLGLHIVEGDPSLNLSQGHTAHHMSKAKAVPGLMGLIRSAKETKVRLEGAPYGRPTQFIFYARTQGTSLPGINFVSSTWDCRFSVRLPVQVPPFEIVKRRPAHTLKVKPELGLPQASFGDPQLDAELALSCADPRLGPALAPAVVGLTSHQYLHIQGQDGVITSLTNDAGMMSSMFDIGATQNALEHIANVCAGPVAPRR